MPRFTVSFEDGGFAPVTVPDGRTLSEELHIKNSPVLFGCRTGVCGTCVVEVVEGAEHLAPPDEDEQEILELYAAGLPRARLACQIDVQGDVKLHARCENRWSGA